jgi:hypothetical protein
VKASVARDTSKLANRNNREKETLNMFGGINVMDRFTGDHTQTRNLQKRGLMDEQAGSYAFKTMTLDNESSMNAYKAWNEK